MVQMFNTGPSKGALQSAILGQALGQGLGNFTGTYFANKALQNVMDNPELKDAPPSEKLSALQRALAPHGERGQRLLQQSFQLEQQRMNEPAYREKMLSKAFGQLENIRDEDLQRMSIPEIISKYSKAFMALPGGEGEIALSRILPAILQRKQAAMTPGASEISDIQQMKRQQFPNFIGGQSPGRQNMGLPEQQQQQLDEPPQPQPPPPPPPSPTTRGQTVNLGEYVPLNVGDLINPEQQSEILTSVNRAGGDVNFTRQQIKDYNEGKLSFNELLNSNVDKQTAQIQKQLGMENNVKSFIDNQVGENVPEADKNIYYNMMKAKLPLFKDMTSAWQSVSKDIANFDKNKKTFIKNIPEGDFYGVSDSAEKQLSSAGKNLLQVDPVAYNILEEAYTQKGHSIVTPARIHNPLPPKVSNITKEAGDYRDLIYPKPGFFSSFSDKDMLANIEEAQTSQEKEIPKLSGQLKNSWNDTVSLINIYTDLKRKGWFPEQISGLFDSLENSGIEFSPQQQKERSQLIETPTIPVRYLK